MLEYRVGNRAIDLLAKQNITQASDHVLDIFVTGKTITLSEAAVKLMASVSTSAGVNFICRRAGPYDRNRSLENHCVESQCARRAHFRFSLSITSSGRAPRKEKGQAARIGIGATSDVLKPC